MGQLLPLRRRFVTRAQFAAASTTAAVIDPDRLRADVADDLDLDLDDPYAR